MSIENLRNIAIVAHVDHGKTTLVDCLLKQSGTFSERTVLAERVMDSNDQEKERGITILAKNTAITWRENRINIVDTPGHADFGGEVERVLSMVDSVLLLVDAMDGPMPQTRFVTQKAFQMGFQPDRRDQQGRPSGRTSRTGCWTRPSTCSTASARPMNNSISPSSTHRPCTAMPAWIRDAREGDMTPLYEAIMKHVHAPKVDPDGPFQMRTEPARLQLLRRPDRHWPHPARQGAHEHAGRRRRSRRQEAQRPRPAGARLHGPGAPRSAGSRSRRHHRHLRHRDR